MPHMPQFIGSLCGFVQTAPHWSIGGGHAAPEQMPALQMPLAQAFPQAPQLRGSCRVLQPLAHSVSPTGQSPPPVVHAPFEQTWLPAHGSPHFPQFAGSVSVLVHSFPHSVCPAPHDGSAEHVEYEHWSPVGHTLPQPPQFIGSVVVSVQMPLHETDGLWHVWPPGGMHMPLWQVSPGTHAWPQIPQLFGSEPRFVHVVPAPQ